jgi:predicted  nucleic acid-binding Zn-ribbon protein
MKKLFAIFISSGILLSAPAYAGLCNTKPEAESKTNTLPARYQKLKKENEALRKALNECKKEKEEIKREISSLESQLADLESERVQLINRLESYPSKWELLMKIRELEEKLGR